MKYKDALIEQIVKKVIIECKQKILVESFQSPKLKKIFNANHDPDERFNGSHINSISDIYFNNMYPDLSRITDDMILGVYNSPREANVKNNTPYMEFNNGVTIVFNDKLKQLMSDAEKRSKERHNSQPTDRLYKEKYLSKNRDYNIYRDTYRMWNKDIENGDKPYFNGDKETKHNSTPSVVKNSYYQRAKDYYKK